MTNVKSMINDQLSAGKKYDIYDRALEFAIHVAQVVQRLQKNIVLLEYQKQLIRSSGSIGANIEEADGALTRKDFVNKMGIARREARESTHWLTLILRTASFNQEPVRNLLDSLVDESRQLTLILSSIIQNTLAKETRKR